LFKVDRWSPDQYLTKEIVMAHFRLFAAAAGVGALFAATGIQAQITRQPAAPLQNAMTESQARTACRAELRGGRREGRRAMAKKTSICVLNKMNGTNR
jgi:hypothetical protein